MSQKISFKEKISNLKRADEQFLYFVTFLYSISTSGVSIIELIKSTENTSYGRNTNAFKDISRLGLGWGYGLARSCEIIAERVSTSKEDNLKQLLVKMAQVIRLGEELKDFFINELVAALHTFVSSYERNLESQKLFLEMFYTLMSTTSIMIATNSMLTMLTGASDTEMILKVSIIAVMGTMGAFALMLYMIFPRDILATPSHVKAKKFRLFLYMGIMFSLLIGTVLYASHTLPSTLIIAIAALPLFIPGFFARKMESEIKRLNEWYPSFIRHFGQIYSSVGSMGISLDAVLKSDFSVLNKHIKSFNNRIKNRIDKEMAFELFSKETSSFLITAGNTIFSRSIVSGSDMNIVGNKVADITVKLNEVKSKRGHTAKTFELVIIILHVMTLAVFALINQIAEVFHDLLADVPSSSGMMKLTPVNPEFLTALMPIVILILSLINAFAIKIAQGGLYKTVVYHIAILNIIGGITMYATATILSKFLNGFISSFHI